MTLKNAAIAAVLMLAVDLTACTTLTGRSTGRNVDDATITAAVKTHLATDGARTLTSIDVDTVAGTVYLNGTVSDAATKSRAGSLAREVEGVKRVVNNLQTKSASAGDAPRFD
jgi:osmotically-inducible protein OsmY